MFNQVMRPDNRPGKGLFNKLPPSNRTMTNDLASRHDANSRINQNDAFQLDPPENKTPIMQLRERQKGVLGYTHNGRVLVSATDVVWVHFHVN
jgi:hypothetical protein